MIINNENPVIFYIEIVNFFAQVLCRMNEICAFYSNIFVHELLQIDSVHWDRLGIVIIKCFCFLRTNKHPSKSWKNFHSNVRAHKKICVWVSCYEMLSVLLVGAMIVWELKIAQWLLTPIQHFHLSSLRFFLYLAYCCFFFFNVTCFGLSKFANENSLDAHTSRLSHS